MEPRTRALWARQDRHEGDRHRLFGAVAEAVAASHVLYPGSYVDLAPSFVWPSVTYVDMDRRAERFFADAAGVAELLVDHGADPDAHEVRFIAADYREPLPLPDGAFDLLISLYTGPALDHCSRYLAAGGHLLANPSHGDVALAAVDDRYRLVAVVQSRRSGYVVRSDGLDQYLVPKRPTPVTADEIRASGRGVAYTKSAFAYLFERVD